MVRPVLDFTGLKSRTHQSFAKDADINNIMMKYQKTGVLGDPSVSSKRVPRWGDFSDIYDFTTQMNRLKAAEADFLTLPSTTREKFNHSVSACLDFIADPANVREAVDLGLLPKDMIQVTESVVKPADNSQPVVPPKAAS